MLENTAIIFTWAAEAGGEILEQIITDFEAENPNIKVELVTLPFGEVRTQAVAGQLSRSIPDIIAMNPPWTREFYDLNMLAPLDDFMLNDETFDKEAYFPTVLEKIEGSTYLVPVNSLAFYLYCNNTMFEAAGLELPKNWDDILTAAKTLTSVPDNQYGITLTMSEQEAANGSILSIYPLLYANNGRTFIDGKFTVETEEMREVLTLLEQIRKDESMLPGVTSRGEIPNVELFANGNVGMLIANDASYLTVLDRNPELDFSVIPIPTKDGTGEPELRHHGWDVAISSTSEHKEEAWKFISYMTSQKNMTAMCEDLLKFPARYDVEVTWPEKYPQGEVLAKSLQELNLVEELMYMPNASSCWVDLTKVGAAILTGGMSVDEAITYVQEAWDERLEQ
ncbi:MAG: hypothetical protein ATN31_11065, partial [Candidatus Epulonipiscioides saccharophilum]